MASTEHESISGVWGGALSWIQGRAPSGVRGTKSFLSMFLQKGTNVKDLNEIGHSHDQSLLLANGAAAWSAHT